MSPYFHQCQSSLTSSYKPKTTRKSFVRTGAVLTLEKSPFQIFHSGNSTFVNSFDKTKFHTSLFHWRTTTVSLETRILNTQRQINSLFCLLLDKLESWSREKIVTYGELKSKNLKIMGNKNSMEKGSQILLMSMPTFSWTLIFCK